MDGVNSGRNDSFFGDPNNLFMRVCDQLSRSKSSGLSPALGNLSELGASTMGMRDSEVSDTRSSRASATRPRWSTTVD
eukprot:3420916-Prymnesium_polylepis.1